MVVDVRVVDVGSLFYGVESVAVTAASLETPSAHVPLPSDQP